MTLFHLIGQEEAQSHWQRLIASGRLGHAHILAGKSGIGKDALAFRIAAALNCQHEQDKPCGDCPACQKFKTLEHPSLYLIHALPRKSSSKTDPYEGIKDDQLEEIRVELARKADWPYHRLQIEGANDIRISAIRKLRTDIYLTTNPDERKVVLILRAHRMNIEAANALLKILEEPPEGAVFLLTTEFPERLPDTILSRCQIHQMQDITWSRIRSYLQDEQGHDPATSEVAARLAQGDLELARLYCDESTRDWIKLIAQIQATLQRSDFSSVQAIVQVLQDKSLFDDPRRQQFLSLLILYFRDLAVSGLLQEGSIWNIDTQSVREAFPDMDAAKAIKLIEECKDSLERKVYLPLALTSLFLGLRMQLRGIGMSNLEEIAAS